MKRITVTKFDWNGNKIEEYVVHIKVPAWNKYFMRRV